MLPIVLQYNFPILRTKFINNTMFYVSFHFIFNQIFFSYLKGNKIFHLESFLKYK